MFIFNFNSIKKRLPAGKKNKGQAIVEYVLILTVVVVTMGGLLLKLNREVEEWGKSIIGAKNGYIACLMQTGLLPGQSTSHLGTPCAAIKTINVSSGSSGGAGGSGGAGSGGAGSGGAGSNASSRGSSSGGGGGSTLNNPENEDDTAFSSSSARGNRNRNSRRKGSKAGGYNPSGKMIAVNSDNLFNTDDASNENMSETGQGRSSRSRRKKKAGFRDGLSISNSNPGGSGQRFRAISSYGYMSSDKDEQKERSTPIPVYGTGSKKQSSQGKEKRNILIQKKKLKDNKENIKIDKWSFGNIFRIIMIIVIIGVVVFLITSQTMQVKKSMK